MPEYQLPTWNQTCKIWLPGNPWTNPPNSEDVPCQLRFERLTDPTPLVTTQGTNTATQIGMWLLLPRGTDVRRAWSNAGPGNPVVTAIELSLRPSPKYFVVFWEDRAAGFPNEHRAAWVVRQLTVATTALDPYIGPFYQEPEA